MNTDFMHELVVALISPIASSIELLALVVIIITMIRALYQLLVVDRLDFAAFSNRVIMESGLSVALQFLMIAEILKTISAVTFMKIVEVTLLVAVRVFLSLVIHYESKLKRTKEESPPRKEKGRGRFLVADDVGQSPSEGEGYDKKDQ